MGRKAGCRDDLPKRRVMRIFRYMSETLLDVKGMNCPLPVLKANRVLRGMPAGGRLRVLATDRAAVGDFQAFCRETGHALLAWSEEAGVFSFVIRRRIDDPQKKGS
jgi:tRNA 2-thiouridine synthesizing protein A